MQFNTLVWDVETNGLLQATTAPDGSVRPPMDRVHCLVIRDFERGVTHQFRRNRAEDTIADGLRMLEQAEVICGHNVLHYDIPACQKVYPWFSPQGVVRDTLPLVRMIFTGQRELDFRLWRKGKLPGAMIGTHSLDAWGHRLGLHKGNYKAECEAAGIDPWAEWNQAMEDYCDLDVDVTALLYRRILQEKPALSAIQLESAIHDAMGEQERNGVWFDVEGAQALADELRAQADKLSAEAQEHYGYWYAPAKKRIIAPLWDNPDDPNAGKAYPVPRTEFLEDESRKVWAEVTVPGKSIQFKDPMKASRTAGAPYCAIERKEFKPTSRQQIVDRFSTIYGWTPVDFTEKGNPEVSDDVLRSLAGKIPMAEELAEVFYYLKRLGQVETGPQAWLKKATDGRIHGYCNTGGTISGRASHTGPNLAQVPKVKTKKGPDGKKCIALGREGDHGFESRRLFHVPRQILTPRHGKIVPVDWTMVGADLSGIELRCLAAAAAPFDNGYLISVILDGDIHEVNRVAAGLSSRDQAKTMIYGLIYGAGDAKLGYIVSPSSDEETQRTLGAELRERFLDNLKGLGAVVKDVQRQARRGHLFGLDGRKLLVRSKHSALNLKLQSDAALIAKKWVLLNEERMQDHGLEQGWYRDWTQMLWIHDEIQEGVRTEHVELAKRIAVEAAAEAGQFFHFACPVAAEAKHGHNWADTH